VVDTHFLSFGCPRNDEACVTFSIGLGKSQGSSKGEIGSGGTGTNKPRMIFKDRFFYKTGGLEERSDTELVHLTKDSVRNVVNQTEDYNKRDEIFFAEDYQIQDDLMQTSSKTQPTVAGKELKGIEKRYQWCYSFAVGFWNEVLGSQNKNMSLFESKNILGSESNPLNQVEDVRVLNLRLD